MSTINLKMANGTTMQVDGVEFGEWAVHQGPRVVHGRGKPRLAWQITHVPTGLSASGCMEMCGATKAEAMKVGRHLSRQTFPTTIDESFGRAVHRAICDALGYPASHHADVRDGHQPTPPQGDGGSE